MREVTFGNLLFFAIGYAVFEWGAQSIGGAFMAWSIVGWLAYVLILHPEIARDEDDVD